VRFGGACKACGGRGDVRVRSGCAVVRCSVCKGRGQVLVDEDRPAVPSAGGDWLPKGGEKIVKAVVMLAFVLACSGSSAATRVVGDAGAGARGRQVGSGAEAVDAVRAVDAVVAPVVDAVPAVVSDARPVVDAVSAVADVFSVSDVRFLPDQRLTDAPDWPYYRNDAGQVICSWDYVHVLQTGEPSKVSADCGYRDDDTGSCVRDLSGSLLMVCRTGGHTWHVRACSECAGLAKWTVRP